MVSLVFSLIEHIKDVFKIDPLPIRGYQKGAAVVLLSVLIYQIMVYYNCTGCKKRFILIWDHASFHVSKMMNDYIRTQKDWLTIIYLPKKAPYLNPNERKINQQIKSCVCANRFYDNIEDQKIAVSEYLNKRFGRWIDSGLCYDT